MCGRYAFSRIEKQLIERLGLKELPPELAKRYNIAPGQQAPVCIRSEAGRRLDMLQWGLVPGWASDPAVGSRHFNARSETAPEKPSFREAWTSRRALVPCDGWFEWRKVGHERQPWFIHSPEEELSTFAALWEPAPAILGPDHPGTFSILTCAAAPAISHLHHRMPVLLSGELREAWLEEGLDAGLLQSGAHDACLEFHRVSRDINRVTIDHADLLAKDDSGQTGLFEIQPPVR